MALALNSLTPRARRVLVRAMLEAEARGQGFVGTEHMLLVMAQDSHDVASEVLGELGVRDQVIERLTAAIGREGGGDAGHESDQLRVGFDPSPRSNHPLVVLL